MFKFLISLLISPVLFLLALDGIAAARNALKKTAP